MTKHFAPAGGAPVLERKDESGNQSAAQETKTAIETVMSAFEEFKSTNDQRLKELEKRGSEDPILTEKLSKIDDVLNKFEDVGQKAAKAEKVAEAQEELKEHLDRIETALKRRQTTQETPEQKAQEANLWARAVVQSHLIGVANLATDQQKTLEKVRDEWKALNVTTPADGGHLAPMEYVREITKGVTEASPVRSLGRVRTTSHKSVEIPKRTGQFAAQWVAEQGTRSETTGLTYGLDEIPTHEFYALIDISNQMLEDSVFNMQAEISEESSEQFAVAEGAAFVNGDGSGKPEGFLQASGVGSEISGAATAITADGLLTLKHSIKTAYTANANFLLNRKTLGSTRKLKDSNGQYLWMPGIADGKPNTIDGDPYVEVPDMPNEGAGTTPVAYGDFRRAYTWVDRIMMEMLRDPYTQATSGNIRFIMRKRVGGMVVLAEAIKKLTCSA